MLDSDVTPVAVVDRAVTAPELTAASRRVSAVTFACRFWLARTSRVTPSAEPLNAAPVAVVTAVVASVISTTFRVWPEKMSPV